MSTSQSILRFLDLETDDFDFLGRYLRILLHDPEGFSEAFYKYLFGHAETATVLHNLGAKKLAELLKKQTHHLQRLLTERFDASYQEDLQRVGRNHHRLGISPAWITGAYARYWESMEALTDSPDIAPVDRPRLRRVLSKIVYADLSLHLQGYALGQHEDECTRTTLNRVLIDTILAERSHGTWDSLLRRMCHGLVANETHVLAAWSACREAGSDALVLSCIAGADREQALVCLPRQADDPCWQALRRGEPVVMGMLDAAMPEWIKSLVPIGTQEAGFFPFGSPDTEYIGVSVFAADSVNYFCRIGFGPFKAFSYFGNLALSLRDQSLRDSLSGLPNRTLFHDRMNHALSGSQRRERLLAVGILDLDGFKAINDRYGHAAGDLALQQVVARMQSTIRPRDTLARLGGDEFGLLLDDLENISQLETFCDRLLEAVRSPLKSEHRFSNLSASLGFTLYPLDDSDGETLLRHADLAMYASKNKGGDRLTVYSTAMTEEAKWQSRVTRDLRNAVFREELFLLYQPQVDMPTGAVIGAEALLRWNHPERGLLAPGEFLDALEDGPVSRRVGRYVIEKALDQVVAWQNQGLCLRVAVNIGTHHLLAPEFVDEMHSILISHPIAAKMLEIEVTETTAIADLSAARDVLAACRNLGVTVALDDFGTGNAPLSYLQTLPADSVKIDRGFVSDILNNPKDTAVVAGVITSARLLGLDVIAEGVESQEHGYLLLQLGCRRAQGYVIAKPMAGKIIPNWVSSYRGDPVWTSCANRLWRPEYYGLLMVTLSHAERSRKTLARLEDPEAPVPEHLLDPEAERHCVLGRWLDGEGGERFADTVPFREVHALHDRLHCLARELGNLRIAGRNENIAEKSRELRTLSEALQERLKNWVEEMHSRRVTD